MNNSQRLGSADKPASRRAGGQGVWGLTWRMLVLTMLSGCGRDSPQATVEGTVRRGGKPLNNCLVTFFPDPGPKPQRPHSTGLTNQQGMYRLRFDDQQEGTAIGWYCVTVQDLSVSTGVRRRDHGTVDAETAENGLPPPVRPSRVPDGYMSPTTTPLRKEIKPGPQMIDLDIK